MFVYSLDGLKIDSDLPPDQEIEEDETTARSGVYQVLGKMFSLPDEGAHQTAVDGKWPERLRDAAELLAFDFDFGISALSPSITPEAYQAEYLRLFEVDDGTQGPPAPIFAGAYGEGADGGGDRRRQIEEVVRAFEYFGLKTSAEETRSPDHLATELEFMQYLTFKQAASASPRLSGSFRRAQEDFIDRQLSSWLSEFAGRVEKANALPIWVWAAKTAAEFVNADARYLKA